MIKSIIENALKSSTAQKPSRFDRQCKWNKFDTSPPREGMVIIAIGPGGASMFVVEKVMMRYAICKNSYSHARDWGYWIELPESLGLMYDAKNHAEQNDGGQFIYTNNGVQIRHW